MSGNNKSFSTKCTTAFESRFPRLKSLLLQASKQKGTYFVARKIPQTLKDVVIGTVSIFTILQSRRNNEMGEIWAFDAARNIFRQSNPILILQIKQ